MTEVRQVVKRIVTDIVQVIQDHLVDRLAPTIPRRIFSVLVFRDIIGNIAVFRSALIQLFCPELQLTFGVNGVIDLPFLSAIIIERSALFIPSFDDNRSHLFPVGINVQLARTLFESGDVHAIKRHRTAVLQVIIQQLHSKRNG